MTIRHALESNARRFAACHAFIIGLLLTATTALGSIVSVPLQSVSSMPTPGEGFKLLPGSDSGILFANALAESRFMTNQIYLNGSGVAAGDVDGDGLCDLFFAGLDSPNKLYRNLGGLKFEDRTDQAGVGCARFACTGVAFADIDNDMDLDLLINTIGEGTLGFRNDGKGNFSQINPFQPTQHKAGSMSMALADADGDGDLDLYVANYRDSTLRDEPGTRFNVRQVDGKLEIAFVDGKPTSLPEYRDRFEYGEGGRVIEHGQPDFFYINQGNGEFRLVPWEEGRFCDEKGAIMAEPRDWGLSVLFRDLNHDGFPDLYVCNDFDSQDRIWMNDGKGFFRALPMQAIRQTPLFSMGIDAGDLNADGWDDFMVLDMLSRDHVRRQVQTSEVSHPDSPMGIIHNRPQYSRNMVFLNRGDHTFAEVGRLAGLEASEWSWAVAFVDVDLDGLEDVLITNGHERDAQNVDIARMIDMMRARENWGRSKILEARKVFPRLDTPNLAFRNKGNLEFEEKSREWGFDQAVISHGMALADLDQDGDPDVVVNNLNTTASIWINQSVRQRLTVQLSDDSGMNRHLGARIKMEGGPFLQSKVVTLGGRYLSSDQLIHPFAVKGPNEPLTARVTWRDGTHSSYSDLMPGFHYLLTPVDSIQAIESTSLSDDEIWFVDSSRKISWTHTDMPYDDFARQAALVRKYSQDGPGVAVYDIDRDGFQDVVVGSGRGGRPAWLRQEDGDYFQDNRLPFHRLAARDQLGILALRFGPDLTEIVIAEDHYEDGTASGPMVKTYHLGDSEPTSIFPISHQSAAGPMAAADVDGDGDLELFVGGRVLPGHIPLPADSLLLQKTPEGWVSDPRNQDILRGMGMVRGAVFSDYDLDGDPDLFLAREWNSIALLENDSGRLIDATVKVGLGATKGWWSGIATGDINADGRPDLVAGNWGRNMSHQNNRQTSVRLYYIDNSARPVTPAWLGYQEMLSREWKPWMSRDILARLFPTLPREFPTQLRFGQADVMGISGTESDGVRHMAIDTLETTVFINEKGVFKKIQLPIEAQWSPVFGLHLEDFNNDGKEDLILLQNFFATNKPIARFDAGCGLLLEGDGTGGFKVVPPQFSGIHVYGECRGSAVADLNQDGKTDLVAAQNAAQLKVFENQTFKKGLRVELEGPENNPDAIGAKLRLGDGTKWGPMKEIQAGSGYLSMNSPVKILALDGEPRELSIHWPGQTRPSVFPLGDHSTAVKVIFPDRLLESGK